MQQEILEDEVVEDLISVHKRHAELIRPEEHYNYYGDRGVVDLFVESESTGNIQHHLYEVKSESAVQSATGANEILRQFNRMRDYFFKGTEHEPEFAVMYKLVFVPTEATLHHLADNQTMYREVMGSQEEEGAIFDSELALYFPYSDYPCEKVLPRTIDDFTDETFWYFMFNRDRELARELQDTFEDICGPLTETEVVEVDEYTSSDYGLHIELGDEATTRTQCQRIPENSHVTVTGIEICPGDIAEIEVEIESPANVEWSEKRLDYWEGRQKIGESTARMVFDLCAK